MPLYHRQFDSLGLSFWPPEALRLSWKGCTSALHCHISFGLQEDLADLDDGTTDGYVFDSPADLEEIAMQRQAIWDLLKNLGSHLLREGVNLTKVSLPVKVFEPRSFLQRITDNWAYIDLLQKAVDATDPVTRMQYVVSTAHQKLQSPVILDTPTELFSSWIKR